MLIPEKRAHNTPGMTLKSEKFRLHRTLQSVIILVGTMRPDYVGEFRKGGLRRVIQIALPSLVPGRTRVFWKYVDSFRRRSFFFFVVAFSQFDRRLAMGLTSGGQSDGCQVIGESSALYVDHITIGRLKMRAAMGMSELLPQMAPARSCSTKN